MSMASWIDVIGGECLAIGRLRTAHLLLLGHYWDDANVIIGHGLSIVHPSIGGHRCAAASELHRFVKIANFCVFLILFLAKAF